jgi:hypothetical protein
MIRADKEKLLKLLEEKDLIMSDKAREENAYQEWILNAPYKFSIILVIGFCLMNFYNSFNKTMLQNSTNRILFFIFIVLNVGFFNQMLSNYSNPQKIRHYINQINRLNQKIKEILEGEKQE